MEKFETIAKRKEWKDSEGNYYKEYITRANASDAYINTNYIINCVLSMNKESLDKYIKNIDEKVVNNLITGQNIKVIIEALKGANVSGLSAEDIEKLTTLLAKLQEIDSKFDNLTQQIEKITSSNDGNNLDNEKAIEDAKNEVLAKLDLDINKNGSYAVFIEDLINKKTNDIKNMISSENTVSVVNTSSAPVKKVGNKKVVALILTGMLFGGAAFGHFDTKLNKIYDEVHNTNEIVKELDTESIKETLKNAFDELANTEEFKNLISNSVSDTIKEIDFKTIVNDVVQEVDFTSLIQKAVDGVDFKTILSDITSSQDFQNVISDVVAELSQTDTFNSLINKTIRNLCADQEFNDIINSANNNQVTKNEIEEIITNLIKDLPNNDEVKAIVTDAVKDLATKDYISQTVDSAVSSLSSKIDAIPQVDTSKLATKDDVAKLATKEDVTKLALSLLGSDSKYDELLNLYNELVDKYNAKVTEFESLKEQNGSLNSEVQALKNQLNQARSDLADAKAKITELDNKLTEAEKTLKEQIKANKDNNEFISHLYSQITGKSSSGKTNSEILEEISDLLGLDIVIDIDELENDEGLGK